MSDYFYKLFIAFFWGGGGAMKLPYVGSSCAWLVTGGWFGLGFGS